MSELTANKNANYQALVIGVSAGGLNTLQRILPKLPENFPLAVIVLQHRGKDSNNTQENGLDFLVSFFSKHCILPVVEAEQLEQIKAGTIYIAPARYHLLIEKDFTFSLSVDQAVNHSIPSIDVLFSSASDSYKSRLIGLILTGASSDGSAGLTSIKNNGGLTLVQDPASAEVDFMPKEAIKSHQVDKIISLEYISSYLVEVTQQGYNSD